MIRDPSRLYNRSEKRVVYKKLQHLSAVGAEPATSMRGSKDVEHAPKSHIKLCTECVKRLLWCNTSETCTHGEYVYKSIILRESSIP